MCVFIKYFQYVHENAYCTTHSTLNYAVALHLEKLEKTKDLYLTPWNLTLRSVEQYKQVWSFTELSTPVISSEYV